MKKILVVPVLILAVISLVLIGCGTSSTPVLTTASPGRVIIWKVATYITPKMIPSISLLNWYASQVEKETGGRLKLQIYTSGSLVGQMDVMDALKSGLCDMAQVNPGDFPTKLPLTSCITLPELGSKRMDLWNLAFSQLVANDQDLQKEYAQWNTVYGWSSHSPIKDIGGNVPVNSVADLNHKKIRVVSATEGNIFKQFGAIPMVISITDTYDALASGLVDLAMHSMTDFYTLKWYQVSKYFTENVGVTKAGVVYLFNKNSWDALPGDIQAILQHMQLESAQMDYYFWHTPELLKATQDAFARQGIQIVQFPSEERTKLQVAGPAAWADWIKTSGGDKAQHALDVLNSEFPKVEAQYPNGINVVDTSGIQ